MALPAGSVLTEVYHFTSHEIRPFFKVLVQNFRGRITNTAGYLSYTMFLLCCEVLSSFCQTSIQLKFKGVENVQNIAKRITLYSRMSQYVHKLQSPPLWFPSPAAGFRFNLTDRRWWGERCLQVGAVGRPHLQKNLPLPADWCRNRVDSELGEGRVRADWTS